MLALQAELLVAESQTCRYPRVLIRRAHAWAAVLLCARSATSQPTGWAAGAGPSRMGAVREGQAGAGVGHEVPAVDLAV